MFSVLSDPIFAYEDSTDQTYDHTVQFSSYSAVHVQKKPRKLAPKSLETKYYAILEVEEGLKTKARIAKEVGTPHNTLSTWLKNAERIKDAYLKVEI